MISPLGLLIGNLCHHFLIRLILVQDSLVTVALVQVNLFTVALVKVSLVTVALVQVSLVMVALVKVSPVTVALVQVSQVQVNLVTVALVQVSLITVTLVRVKINNNQIIQMQICECLFNSQSQIPITQAQALVYAAHTGKSAGKLAGPTPEHSSYTTRCKIVSTLNDLLQISIYELRAVTV